MSKNVDKRIQRDFHWLHRRLATQETAELVENICSMHLGVNLRKAFQSAVNEEESDQTKRKYFQVDTMIREFWKLLGVPEYTHGAQSFPDFLTLMSTDADEERRKFFQTCTSVTLDRQVGSRYFVSAANATKIYFLKDAAIDYLKYTGKNKGNKLEKSVYAKLQEPHQLTLLRADGLMYYHVYADQVQSPSQDSTGYEPALSGTEDISTGSPKSSRNTARHMCFHLKVTCMGRTRMLKSQDVYEHLFERDGSEECALYPVVVVGATAMQQKLCSYAWKQLPGGIYWDPEPSVREILAQLKPTNDVVESTLGLNDYLTTAVPNLHQMARSNLVEVKKNKSQHSATKGTGRGIRSSRQREAECLQGEQTGCTKKKQHGTGVHTNRGFKE